MSVLLHGDAGDFNSRPCERGDSAPSQYTTLRLISIHAPARGATRCQPLPLLPTAISIHAPARGATWKSPFRTVSHKFQFTPLREGRRVGKRQKTSFSNFNSRPCERGDKKYNKRINIWIISIHAPARGATDDGCGGVHVLRFQFTPLREGRPDRPHDAAGKPHFNSRPCERGDHTAHLSHAVHGHFNSRPCERGDSKIKQSMLCFFCNYREKLLIFRQHQLS